MSQEVTATVRRFWEEVFNKADLALADELFTPDHVMHNPHFPEELHGPDTMKGFTWLFHKVMPGLEVNLEDQIAEGDTVASRWTFRGALADKLQKDGVVDEVTVSGISFSRVYGDQIAESWMELHADLDGVQAPMPDDEILEWLRDDYIEGEVPFLGLPDIRERWMRICCRPLRICC